MKRTAKDEVSASGDASAVDSGGGDEPEEGPPRVDVPIDVEPVEDQLADRFDQASPGGADQAAMRTTGDTSTQTVRAYIEDGELFSDPASKYLGL